MSNSSQIALISVLFIAATATLSAQTLDEASASHRLERLERAVQLLQQRNTELEQEVAALKKTRAAARPPESIAPTPAPAPTAEAAQSIGTHKAVVEESKPKEKPKVFAIAGASEVKLTLGGFVQMQFEGGDVLALEGRFPGANEIKDRFRIRRGRITLTGDYKEEFDFKVEGEFALSDTALTIRDAAGRTLGSNSTRTNFGATDIFINWHRLPELNVKAGQFKAPVGLEQLTSDTKLFTAERSLVTTALTPERQIGVMLWGKPFANLWPEQKELLNYSLGVFNGTGRNISVNDNNEFMYAGRLEVLAMKSKILNQDTTLKFGVNGFASRDEAGTTVSSLLRENNDGSLAAFSLPSAGEREGYGIDAALHIGPFDLVAEYLNERIDPRVVNGIAPLFTSLRPEGFYVQGSYFVIPKALQLVAKWESFDPDQFVDDDIHSFTAGVNWYIKGDEIKLIADYVRTWSDFRDNNPAFEHAEFDEVIIRLQLMF